MGEAIALAREIADRGLILETPPNEAFDRMRAEPAYATVDAQMSENAKPKGAAQIYADYVQPDLLPEAISSAGKKMLIGSVRTGEIFSAGATLAPLARLNGGVFDIEQRTSIVFVAVNSQLAFERRGDAPPFAMVAELDPQTGSEIARNAPGPGPSLIGDIEVAKDGRIFASDSLTPRIIIFDHAGPTKISRMAGRELTDPRFVNLQGLALDEKRGRLFDIPIALTYEISATLFDRTFFQNQNSGKALFFFDSSLLTAYASRSEEHTSELQSQSNL